MRALDPLLGREVASKVLLDPEARRGKLRRRLEREARLLAALDHPNIATIHALETIAGAACLILELVGRCRFEDEALWLTQAQMAELFQTTPQKHHPAPQGDFRQGGAVRGGNL